MAAHGTLATEQLISHARTTMVGTIAYLQDCDGGLIVASEVHELLTSIHCSLDNAVSK